MKYNPRLQEIENMKADGLQIVDKRGIKFDDEHERNMIWEGHIMLDQYIDRLNDYDGPDWFDSRTEYRQAIKDFRQDFHC